MKLENQEGNLCVPFTGIPLCKGIPLYKIKRNPYVMKVMHLNMRGCFKDVAMLSVAVHFITCFHTGAIPYWQKSYSDLIGHVFSILGNKILIPFITRVLADVYGLDCVTWINVFQPFFHGTEDCPTTLTFLHSLWGRLNTADIPEVPDSLSPGNAIPL